MMPIVFWASFAPWLRLKKAADSNCRRLNQRSTRDGGVHRKIQWIAIIRLSPKTRPMSGERKMKIIVLVQPPGMTAANPAFATAAPAYPPIRACDELVGRPKYHVIKSYFLVLRRPPRIT